MATSIGQLDSYYTSLINDIMTYESQPVKQLTTKKDTQTSLKTAYSDMKTKFDALKAQVSLMRSSLSGYALVAGRGVTVQSPSGFTVATATAGSAAIPGQYTIDSVTQLARSMQVRSDQQLYSDQALGLSGTFTIGGAAVRGQNTISTIANTVTSFATAGLSSGQQELGTDSYYVETRNDPTAGWQFRLVNSEGKAMSIRSGSEPSTYTESWQTIPTSGEVYDTGRGLTVQFGTDSLQFVTAARGSGAARLDYSAQAASITIDASKSMVDIATEINNASYGAGNEVQASIIDRQLILKNKTSGEAHTIAVSGDVMKSLGVLNPDNSFKNYNPATESAKNAVFSVNGLPVVRSSNSSLTDVISGISLNLTSDAEGKSATLTVTSNMTAAKNVLNSFVKAFNDLQTYLKGKTAVTRSADGTVTRGTFASESMLRSVNGEMYAILNADYSNTGTLTNLSQMGFTFNDTTGLTISDASLLDNVMNSKMGDVTKLMDRVMNTLDAKLTSFTGTSGYVETQMTNSSDQIKQLSDRISSMNTRLTKRQEALVKHYAEIQVQMTAMQSQMTQIGAMFKTS
jgi:flagellar hook-associated protein 2